MPPFTLTGLRIYPVKSLGGIELARWPLDPTGLRDDRRWMVVDPDGQFVTQRETPRLALVRPRLEDGGVTLAAAGAGEVWVPRGGGARERVRVWGDHADAERCTPEADAWLSARVERPLRLVYFPDGAVRPSGTNAAGIEGRVMFADAFPLLLLTEASLEALNRKLETPLPMNRFRPNLVVGGAEGFAEDAWRRISVGPLALELVKDCLRCVTTTVDQETGVAGSEPLRTLARFRRVQRGVRFGRNAVPAGVGALAIGDPVTVLDPS